MRTNILCMLVRYSYGCGRIVHDSVYAIRANSIRAEVYLCM